MLTDLINHIRKLNKNYINCNTNPSHSNHKLTHLSIGRWYFENIILAMYELLGQIKTEKKKKPEDLEKLSYVALTSCITKLGANFEL